MEEWYCFKCEEKMEEGDVYLVYKNIELPGAVGIKCPKCGVEYMLEKFVIELLLGGEKMMESK